MNTKALFLFSIAVMAIAPAMGFAESGSMPTSAEITQQFAIWNAALQTRNPQQVAALYCEHGGVLIPTLSNQIRSNRAEIADYFEHFLQLQPSGTIDQSFVRILAPGVAINSGIYTFYLTKNGKAETVRARFTFVYKKEHGRWCIMEQHSSAMPESSAPATH